MSTSEAFQRGMERGRRKVADSHREPVADTPAARLAQHSAEYEASRPTASEPVEGETALQRGLRLGRDRGSV